MAMGGLTPNSLHHLGTYCHLRMNKDQFLCMGVESHVYLVVFFKLTVCNNLDKWKYETRIAVYWDGAFSRSLINYFIEFGQWNCFLELDSGTT